MEKNPKQQQQVTLCSESLIAVGMRKKYEFLVSYFLQTSQNTKCI